MDVKDRTKTRSRAAAQAERMERDLSAIRRALRKPIEAQVAEGALTVPQIALMHEVVSQPGIALKELSRRLSLAHSTVSGIVDRLEKRGMIERRVDSSDGRVSSLHPSAPVEQFVREQIPVLARGPLQSALERTTPAERAQIERALRRLRELLEQS
jgi:DNA-binding MarR family transcriptional regulator